ncbi:unnamed protein product [Blepharisma stoltei]|uniref:Uncharacterized protein n=1 Tax=Blepharisma stoltei TaxID=1481888 RepID=A0AAU9IFB3_9CILI|nr:unnamed protein product [Blepharisma stoltei]
MDSACESTTADRNINEVDVPKYIFELTDEAFRCIMNGQFDEALIGLIKCEEMIEAVVNKKGYVDPDVAVMVLHNIAVCYQNLGSLEECVDYLENCLLNRNSKKIQNSNNRIQTLETQVSDKIKKETYQCKSNLNLCAISSQLSRHEIALLYARRAAGNIYEILQDCFKLCTSFILRLKKARIHNNIKNYFGSSNTYIEEKYREIIDKNYPIVASLNQIVAEKEQKQQQNSKMLKLNIKSAASIQNIGEKFFYLKLEEAIAAKPLAYRDLKSSSNLIAEISKERLYEKICLLVISYFFISTELWFLNKQENSETKFSESKKWHYKSLEIAEKLMPYSSPILQNIKDSYYDRYPLNMVQNIFIKNTEFSLSQTKMSDKKQKLKKVYGRSSSVKPNIKNFSKTLDKFQSRNKTPLLITTKQGSSRSSKSPSRLKRKSITDRDKIENIDKFNKTVENTKQKKEEINFENTSNNKITNNLMNLMKTYDLSDDSSGSSESSFDEEYFRQNFILTSNDLYGNFDKETNENKKKNSTSKRRLIKIDTKTSEMSNEDEFMPAIRLINPNKESNYEFVHN